MTGIRKERIMTEWKREELLGEKHKKLEPCVERALKKREGFIAQDARDEDMVFVMSAKEIDLVKDIYNDTPIMFLGMNIKVA